MAILRIRRGTSANLPTSAFEGELLGVVDTQELYMGQGAGNPNIKISDVVVVDALPTSGVKDKLYITRGDGKMHYYNATNAAFVLLNGGGGGGVPHVATKANLPTSGVTSESIYYVEDENKFYDATVDTAGTVTWAETGMTLAELDTRYYTKTDADGKFANVTHTHTELHSHTNKAELDRFGVSAANKLTIDGVEQAGGSGASKSIYNQNVAAGAKVTLATGVNEPMVQIQKVIGGTGDLVPVMTSDVNGAVTVIYSGQYNTDTHAANNAFDNDFASVYTSNGGGVSPTSPRWIGIDFGEAKVVNKATLTNRDSTATGYEPLDFKIQASNDNFTTVVDLFTRTGESTWGVKETKAYSFTNTTGYRYYRVFITETKDAAYDWTSLSEIEFIGELPKSFVSTLDNEFLYSHNGAGSVVVENKTTAAADLKIVVI